MPRMTSVSKHFLSIWARGCSNLWANFVTYGYSYFTVPPWPNSLLACMFHSREVGLNQNTHKKWLLIRLRNMHSKNFRPLSCPWNSFLPTSAMSTVSFMFGHLHIIPFTFIGAENCHIMTHFVRFDLCFCFSLLICHKHHRCRQRRSHRSWISLHQVLI